MRRQLPPHSSILMSKCSYGPVSEMINPLNEEFMQQSRLQMMCCVMFQIERIKRANNLWTNDSLFLRDHLLIPVPCGSSEQQSFSGPVISSEQLPHVPSGFSKVPMSPQRHREKLQRCQSADVSNTVALMAEAEDDLNHIDVVEYFKKCDSRLAKLKTDASKIESKLKYDGCLLLLVVPNLGTCCSIVASAKGASKFTCFLVLKLINSSIVI